MRGRLFACSTVAALLLLPAVALAQIPLELAGRRVVRVEIAGPAAGITPDRAVGIPLNAPVSRRLLQNAVRRLFESGLWSDVQLDLVPHEEGVKVVAYLVPRVLLARIEWVGNDLVDDAELARISELDEEAELREGTLDAARDAIVAAYGERGYERVRVESILRDTDDPGRKVLRVAIQEGEPTRIVHVRFDGTAPPGPSGAETALDLDVGDVLDRRVLEDSVRAAEQTMRERGWLEARLGPARSVTRSSGAVVTVPSSPGPRYELVLHGIEPLRRGDLEDVVTLGVEPLSNAVMESMEVNVEDLYRRFGFLDVDATVRRAPGENEGEAELVVEVVPGPRVRVAEVELTGARHFEQDYLREQLVSYLTEDLPGGGVFEQVDSDVADRVLVDSPAGRARRSPVPLDIDPSTVFYEPTYREAVEHIGELYAAAGFLAAQVGPARLERLGPDRVRVVIPVLEGPRTTLYRMTIEGNEELTTHDLLVAAGLERGAPFSYLALEEARIRIVDLYQDRGYLYVRVEPTVLFSGDRTRAEVRVQVVESYPVHVGEILVEGAETTDEAIIRDRLRLAPGDLYRPELARESQERLLSLGIFTGVNVAPVEPDLPERVKDIVVTVAERKPQYVDATIGISTGQGLRGGFEYGYRNLFGAAITTTLRVQLGFQLFFIDPVLGERYSQLSVENRLERNLALGVNIPHIPKLTDLRLATSVYHRRENERDFGLDQNGVGLSATLRLIRRTALSLGGNLEYSNVQLLTDDESLDEYLMMNMDPRLERLLRVPDGESTILAFPATFAVDLRDRPFDPTKGFSAAVTGEYAVTLASQPTDPAQPPFESNFIKLTLAASGYVPVTDWLVFAAQVRFGRVFHLQDQSKTYPNRAYYLGGADTMRGYFQDAMIPQDLADQIIADPALTENDVVRAGDTFVLVRGELRFPIVGDLRGGIFADIGNLWADPTQFDLLAIRPTAGIGLRLATPVGPLAFDYGFIILRRREIGEPLGSFHFSIGLF